MNILIPHTWLLEHLDTDATPEEIQKYLSLCGPSVERIHQKEGDSVYDIEVTTNRVDCMCVRGIAREAAVILQQFGKKAKLKKMADARKTFPKNAHLPLPTVINDDQTCRRTMCVALANVERTPTPEWMAKRLRQIDINVHDSVIDITNYITHDLGHPCHAFDYDQLMKLGGIIIIKEAAPGKKFRTLDNVEYTTVGGEVVFENDKGEIIDLAGIKGTANSSINSQTKNVLLWIENTSAQRIRFASMTHAIRTVAAQMNEKNVDPYLAPMVLEAGIDLYTRLTHAQVASKVYDDFPGKKKPITVKVPLERITEYLGVELSVNKIDHILEDLGCDVVLKSGAIHVTPPTFRQDIAIPADVIEEIARIYGYHNLPSVLMPTAIPLNKPTHTNFTLENRVKHFLANIGWQELYTYSMVSESLAEQSGFPLAQHLKIQNPLSDDRVYLRRTLIPSLEEMIQNNSQRKNLSVFEVANVYHPRKNDLPNEVLHIGIVSTRTFREVKGDLEALFASLFITNYRVQPLDTFPSLYQQLAEIVVQDAKKSSTIGEIGVLPNGHVAIQLRVTNLWTVVSSHPTYQPIPKTSEIVEDLTFTLPAGTAMGDMIAELKTQSEILKTVELKDIYNQNYTFTFTYNDPSRNLTMEDITPIRRAIVQYVRQNWQGTLVGNLE